MQWTETTILKLEFFTPLCPLGSDVTSAVKTVSHKSFFSPRSPELLHAFAASGLKHFRATSHCID